MKVFDIITIALLAAAASVSLPAHAKSPTQGFSPDGVVLNKNVVKGDLPNTYTINLETYVTGDETSKVSPIDVALILDTSFSMNEISTGQFELYGTGSYNISTITGLANWDAAKKLPCPSGTVTLGGSGQKAYFTNYAILRDGVYYSIALALDNSYYVHILAVKKNNDGSAYEIIQDYGSLGSSKFNQLAFNQQVTLYKTSEVGRKIDLLKKASNTFIDILAGGSSSEADHYMSILGFNNSKYLNGDKNITESSVGDGATVIKQFKQLRVSNNVTALHNAINNSLDYKGQTYPQFAVNLTAALYDKQKWSGSTLFKDNGHQKVVVLMTDGEPGSGSFDSGTANSAVSALYTLKSTYKAKVYTVGVFDGSIDVSNTYQYMNAASSNFPDAKTYGVGDVVAHDYFRVVGAKSLEDIFSDIATEVISGGADYDLKKATTTVIDVVSPSFKLPDNADASKITLSLAKCTGVTPTGPDGSFTYTFDTPVPATTIEPDIKARIGVLNKKGDGTIEFVEQKDGKAVSITGFGFSEKDHWVGKRTSGSGSTYGGYKLIISFPIEIDPRNPGGANVATNTEDSGIYTDDGSGYKQIGGFDIPHAKIPNLVVLKYGLHKGESATYNIYRHVSDGEPVQFPIVLVTTQQSDDPNTPCIARVKIQTPGRYEVEETTWSWAYNLTERVKTYDVDDEVTGPNTSIEKWNELGYGDPGAGYQAEIPLEFGTVVPERSSTIIRNVNDLTEDPNYKGTLFIFRNTMKSNLPAHAEANKNNEFKKMK